MRIHWIQHVPYEGLGTIGEWASERGHFVTGSLALTESYPDPITIDWLVVMGGAMGVHDEPRHPWLVAEKRFIYNAIDSGARVLGVCLGAQLAADVLGAQVSPNAEREVGWFPVELTPEGRSSRVFGVLPERFLAGQWHADTFEVPPGGVRMASSEACVNQAFEWEERVYGLQFHLEWDAAAVSRLADECGGDLSAGRYIQAREQLLGQPRRFDESRELMFRLLDAMDVG